MPRTADIAAGCCEAKASSAASVASHQSSGRRSLQLGCGRWTSSGTTWLARTVCVSSTSTALMPDVPRSMPRYMALLPLLLMTGRFLVAALAERDLGV